jgi:hypothetical protein
MSLRGGMRAASTSGSAAASMNADLKKEVEGLINGYALIPLLHAYTLSPLCAHPCHSSAHEAIAEQHPLSTWNDTKSVRCSLLALCFVRIV